MSELSVFGHDRFDPNADAGVIHYPATGQTLRWARVDGIVWLHFADLCKGTGHTNPRSAIHLIDDEDKRKIDMRSISAGRDTVNNLTADDGPLFAPANAKSNAEAWFVNEDGFTTLGLAGRGDGPRMFRRWIVKVVLPAFRRMQRQMSRKELALMVVAAEEEKERAQLQRDKARAALETARPKVEVYETWLSSAEAVEMTDFAKRIGFTPPGKFTATLRDMGILRKDKTHAGRFRNLPTKDWEGAFDITQTQLPTGQWIDLALINTSGQLEILEALRDAGYDV